MTEIENLYSFLGGRFISPASEIKNRLDKIKAFVFDWDGVFNSGEKNSVYGSTFTEVDSMGCNMLRFSFFLRNGTLPLTAIISGEKNETAFYFCVRENFAYSFHKVPQKIEALKYFCKKEGLEPSEVAYFFDDVLDIPIAEICGLRIMVNQKINPLFTNYCVKNHLVDYLCASAGGQFAVREGTELLIGINCNYNEVIQGRTANTEVYQDYIRQRRLIKPHFFTMRDGKIEEAEGSGKLGFNK
jgi:3-deoxy-D-manno-octulosonate 8-phosphate phosphatase (KDO 8-P phosphatase)